MMTKANRLVVLLTIAIISLPTISVAQQDTSSFFPLGLWGMWIEFGPISPWPPDALTTNQWVQEKSNFNGTKANYMVAWYPYTFFNQLMDYTDTAGYKIDMNMESYGNTSMHDFGLQNWVKQLRNNESFPTGWHDTVTARINHIKNTYGSRPSMHSYYIGHESDFWGDYCGQGCLVADTSHWKGYEYVINKVQELDPTHKSYAVHWGCNG
jgi:hypothetical protein